jgi:hypothetical protein
MRRSSRLLLWPGLALAWTGYWAPWIAHRAAALQTNGYDLGEWITRLPEVRDGSLRLGRLDFLLPLAALSLLTALAAVQPPGLTPWLRWPARLLALLGALLILPEYPFILTAHADPELRPALILGVLTILAVAGLGLADPGVRLKEFFGWVGAAYCLLALAALGFTARALWVVWPSLARLFHSVPGLNWGPFALGAGLLLVFAAGLGWAAGSWAGRARQ